MSIKKIKAAGWAGWGAKAASQKVFKYPREFKTVHRAAYKEEIGALRIKLTGYWVEFKKKGWQEELNATTGASDRALEFLSCGVIERQFYRHKSGFFVFRVRPIKCGKFKRENQTLLGGDDHLLQHLPSFNFDLNDNHTNARKFAVQSLSGMTRRLTNE